MSEECPVFPGAANGSVERLPPNARSPWWGEHRSRYRFASPFVRDRRVLDIACGSGFGCDMLREAGASVVVGVDIEAAAVGQARAAFPTPVCQFLTGDGTALPFADGTFGLVTSFETIEHISNYSAFVTELRRVSHDGATLILSTPNHRITSQYPRNPFHVHEFDSEELRELLAKTYRRVELLGQLLAPHYRVAPFLPGRDRARTPFDHVRLLVWKLANRLPYRAKDALARALVGHPFYPTETDFRFETSLNEAPVVVALCEA